jgi:opacity protein-like surface antigen
MALMMIGLAASARAEITVSPFLGAAFGGNVDDAKIAYGLGFGLRGEGSALGFELDFGHAPDFFPETAIDDSSVTTLMGNLVLTAPRAGSRLYASGGIGIVKARVNGVGQLFDLDSNEFGFNAGAGVLLFLGSGVGLRADLRYFRALTDPEPDDEFDVDLGDLDFWRASAGVVLRF